MKELLMLSAAAEGLTGLILIAYPPIVIRLLFDSEIAGAGVVMSRLAGSGLIALGVACWPDRDTLRPFFGMLTFGMLAALCLVYVAVSSKAGILLWPAVAVHTGLSLLLIWAWWKERRSVPAIA